MRSPADSFLHANFVETRVLHICLADKRRVACCQGECTRPNSSRTATSSDAGNTDGRDESGHRQIRISLSRQEYAAGDSGAAGKYSKGRIQERARRPIERRLQRSSVHADDKSSLPRVACLAQFTTRRCSRYDRVARKDLALFGADSAAATVGTVL